MAHCRQRPQALLALPGVTRLASGEQSGPQARAQVLKADRAELTRALKVLQGRLTATLIGEPDELLAAADLMALLQDRVGRLLLIGYPTGVEVCDAMVHGDPVP